MKRHAPRFLGGTEHDAPRVAAFDQRTDGEAQLVDAIGLEKRAEQRRSAFAEHLPEPALCERVEHDIYVESLLSTYDDVGDTGERFLLRLR